MYMSITDDYTQLKAHWVQQRMKGVDKLRLHANWYVMVDDGSQDYQGIFNFTTLEISLVLLLENNCMRDILDTVFPHLPGPNVHCRSSEYAVRVAYSATLVGR